MPEANRVTNLMHHHVFVFTTESNGQGGLPANATDIAPAPEGIKRAQSRYFELFFQRTKLPLN